MNQTYWIWYPGDFAIHQGMLQNFSREERGMQWPAYWYLEDCYRNVKFLKTYQLKNATSFMVCSHQPGYVTVNEQKYSLNEPINLTAGEQQIVIYVFSAKDLPCVYVAGAEIYSDASWVASNYIQERPVGWSAMFTSNTDDPNQIPYRCRETFPKQIVERAGGKLIDFGREINATVRFTKLSHPIQVCYGESVAEALDTVNCYYQQRDVRENEELTKRAFRYLFIPDYPDGQLEAVATQIDLPMQNHGIFKSDDPLLNQIWQVSLRTFKLCSDLFFIDGIKRDRWIWGGDAYQDNFINQYSFFNEEVDRRTILALRGHDEVHQHINTIVDYSLLWIISIYNHYEMSGDRDFLQMIMPRMEKMMDYLLAQTNSLGFIIGRPQDWIFVDWSPIDKEGPVAAEQMFLLQALKAMAVTKKVLGKTADAQHYQQRFDQLKQNVWKYFWDEASGAFIDSYESKRRHVTRHANILAVLFAVVDRRQQQLILDRVLLNDRVTALTTPYFKFFEQDALCKLGQYDQVYQTIKEYWGAMVEKGATTVWEEYDPQVSGDAQYAMYGDPFGKSLCHTWGASPVYLLGRYFFGLRPTQAGYTTFEIQPHLAYFQKLHGQLPIKDGLVHFKVSRGQLAITCDRNGGTVISQGKRIPLLANQPVVIPIA
ncbi:alpha-rhamnosidase [Pediococcus acidilactici]|uniref:alpha-L-rhamnosidase-related protein n=1 Tax=Pediococcus acidilactici TaxID=1254 RepID=UPI000FFCCE78|nr:trehalase family glycosidase [Pediococcus acidilactici]QAR70863.1 alpha-rhamnosidase [Pediococcus acidilactici]